MQSTLTGTYVVWKGSAAAKWYTPWFPRGGLSAVCSIEVAAISGAPTLEVDIQTKNLEETSFATLASFSSIDATGKHTKDVEGLEEQVRLRFSFSAGSAGDWLYLILPIPRMNWLPY